MEADPQHGQDGQQDEGIGGTHRHALAVLQRLLLLPQHLAVSRNALGAVGGVLILQRIPQAAQVFQHIAVGVGEGLAVGAGGFVTASGRPDGQGRAHQQVARQQHQRWQQMIPGREAGHADNADHRDADRRDGVGIEDFQLFDVGGDQADEVAAVAALQLGGGQAAERPKDPIADEGQQLEGDRMVGCLLGIPQHTAQQRKHQDAGKNGAHRRDGAFQPSGSQQAEATEDGDEGGAEVSRHPHRDGGQHHRQHRPNQHDEPPDDRKRTAFFRCVHALTSPRSSSCFWALYRRL